jgi:hypothetical protein
MGLMGPASAGPLDGKTFVVQISALQNDVGYAEYLMRPLAKNLIKAGMRSTLKPPPDLVANVFWSGDGGSWHGSGAERAWRYRFSVTVGLSPDDYPIPFEGTPAFGVEAVVYSESSDNEETFICMMGLAARTAVANYRPTGLLQVDGASCRKGH